MVSFPENLLAALHALKRDVDVVSHSTLPTEEEEASPR
jgi:hypothetical protein